MNTMTHTKEDSSGNRLYYRCTMSENNLVSKAEIHLKLKGENHTRKIGKYYAASRSFYCIRNSAKHYHRKMKGYGFNWSAINDVELDIQTIHLLIDDKERYAFGKDILDKYGVFLNFKSQGFELQRFLPIDIIRKFPFVPTPKNEEIKSNS